MFRRQMIGCERTSRFNFTRWCVWQMKLKELACAIGFHFCFGRERGEIWDSEFYCQGFTCARALGNSWSPFRSRSGNSSAHCAIGSRFYALVDVISDESKIRVIISNHDWSNLLSRVGLSLPKFAHRPRPPRICMWSRSVLASHAGVHCYFIHALILVSA